MVDRMDLLDKLHNNFDAYPGNISREVLIGTEAQYKDFLENDDGRYVGCCFYMWQNSDTDVVKLIPNDKWLADWISKNLSSESINLLGGMEFLMEDLEMELLANPTIHAFLSGKDRVREQKM